MSKPIASECMFSGEKPTNDEHVIPRWMQARFKLFSQTVCVSNGRKLQYKHVRVPVSAAHSTKFGVIEQRISRGHFVLQEVYLWALKIYVGFIFRDALLRLDRSQPDSGSILDVDDFGNEIWLFRALYDVWSRGGTIGPNPFGTVIILDALTPTPTFGFVHCLWSGTVVLQLGTKLIYVSLWDQGDGGSANLLEGWWKHHKPFVEKTPAGNREAVAVAGQRVWACETSYWLWRQRRGLTFISGFSKPLS